MSEPRFRAGQEFSFDGIQFRVTRGRKQPRVRDAEREAEHPDGDLKMMWETSAGWVSVSCHPLFLLTDFIAWNEDYLFPPPEFDGGRMILDHLRVARTSGHEVASMWLYGDRAVKDAAADQARREGRLDWPAIWAEEKKARARGGRLSKCVVCGEPMWADQIVSHHSCRGKGGA